MIRFLHALAPTALILLAVLFLDARLTGVRADDATDCTKGRGDTAIRGCSRFIKSRRMYGEPISKNNLAKAYDNRGAAYGMKGQYVRAIADFGQWIKLKPTDTMAYYNRGLAYESNGQFDKAVADYRKALQRRPGNKLATFRLKEIAKLRKAGGG